MTPGSLFKCPPPVLGCEEEGKPRKRKRRRWRNKGMGKKRKGKSGSKGAEREVRIGRKGIDKRKTGNEKVKWGGGREGHGSRRESNE